MISKTIYPFIKLLLCTGLLLNSTLCAAQIPFWVPRAGLVAWYPFDNNTNDQTPFVNHGIPYNVTPVADRFGNANGAYAFNGQSSSIEIQDNASLRSATLTLTAWIKPANADVAQLFTKCNKHDGQNEAYKLSTELSFDFKQKSNCVAGAGWKKNPFQTSVRPNEWQFVVSVYDGDTIRNYLNDTLVAKIYNPGGIDPCAGGYLRLGYGYDGNPAAFNGVIDDVAIYNRAINDCEVHRLYYRNHTGIDKPPADVTIKQNGTATFSMTAIGNNVSYWWEENAGTGFYPLYDGGIYGGTHTQTLTISKVPANMSGYQYRCLAIVPGMCTEASSGAVMKVSSGPLDPVEAETERLACDGETVYFGKHIITQAGTYTDTFRASRGQDSIVHLTVRYNKRPLSSFELSPSGKVFNEPVHFTDMSAGAIRHKWEFGDGTTSLEKNPVHQYLQSGLFTACLIVTNSDGCTDTVCHETEVVIMPAIGIPEAFSPNGDGVNDMLYVQGTGVKEFHLRVYDRWGQQIYETSVMNTGWGGDYNGMQLDMNVMAYVLDAVMINNTTVHKQGNITIIR